MKYAKDMFWNAMADQNVPGFEMVFNQQLCWGERGALGTFGTFTPVIPDGDGNNVPYDTTSDDRGDPTNLAQYLFGQGTPGTLGCEPI